MNIKFEFPGKNVLVTGAATGMGKVTALQFAKAGANVIVADFNETEGQKTADECKAIGGKTMFCKIDVSDEKGVKAMADKVIKEYGYIDYIISNAGKGPKDFGNPFTKISANDIRDQFNVNTLGFVNMVKAFREMLVERKQGKIVATASIALHIPTTLHPHYGASKYALYSLVKSMAVELGNYNINVNAIAPGFVYTPIYHEATMFKDIYPGRFDDCKTSEEVVNKMAMQSALRRMQSEEDMANAIMFLCTDEASNITGYLMNIDSGRTVL